MVLIINIYFYNLRPSPRGVALGAVASSSGAAVVVEATAVVVRVRPATEHAARGAAPAHVPRHTVLKPAVSYATQHTSAHTLYARKV